jgi:MarR family multiple antibiotic resistance transcriptional regulator
VATNTATNDLNQFFDDLVRVETRLYNAMNERLRDRHGVVTTQFEFLRYFHRNPGSRVADTAAYFAAGVGAISKGIDRLERNGWVRRHPNPSDGRSSLVSLTPSGLQLVEEAEATFTDSLDHLVRSAVPSGDLDAARAALAALRSSLERDRIGLPVG